MLRRWLVGYVALLFGTLPLALPVWTRFLQASLGRFITVEQIHLAEYVGLGWLSAAYARTFGPSRGRFTLLLGFVAGMSLLDEALQRWLPGRFFDWRDVGLNLAGGIAGLACQHLTRGRARGDG